MRTKFEHDGLKGSLIERVRRKQIVTGAISTIAANGLAHSSLAKIAADVGVSRGVISYHFSGRDELIEQVINALFVETNRFVKARVDAVEDAAAKLRAYIEASFEFMIDNRDNFVALVDIWGSFGSPEAKQRFNATMYDPCRRHVERLLRQGQDSGAFRAFDPSTLATTIQGAIDGVMLQWVFDEHAVDLTGCAAELVAIFDLATRA
ncbi:TetR/AcrR family transcriptional regulator [Streptosporangium sp. NPDC002544]|uniref:TetR/AcrR family transcriptional regulator n=1 Tax=Streptosporangium sp. NPDC002544 TaxID=3154538 RepID=UPI0033243605